jgi:hypothetical protein
MATFEKKVDGKNQVTHFNVKSTCFSKFRIGEDSFEIKFEDGSIIFNGEEVEFLTDAFRSHLEDEDDDFDDDFEDDDDYVFEFDDDEYDD